VSSFRACASRMILPRFVKTLQGKSVGGQTPVRIYPIGAKTHGLSRDLHGFLILPLLVVHDAQIAVRSKILWVALNLLLICLGRLSSSPVTYQ